jgi:hypothetical protein
LKPEFTELFHDSGKRKAGKLRRNLYTFAICLGLSIFLWTLVRFSKDYIYTVEYHLTYKQLPEYVKLVNEPDSLLTLNIRVQGFDFFSEEYFRTRERSWEVSLKGLKLRQAGENQLSGFILTRNIAMDISRETIYPLEIYSTSPDTIFFRFERRLPRRPNMMKLSVIGEPARIRHTRR